VWLTAVATPGPYLGPHGIYAPSNVTGAISWAGGAPFADAALTPSVEVWSNASAATPVAFSVALAVVNRGACTYDLALIAPPGTFDQGWEAYERLLTGFSPL
jgi:hypothetical protein